MTLLRRFLREAPACSALVMACAVVFCIEVVQSGSLLDPVSRYEDPGQLAWNLMMVASDVTEGHEWWRLVTGPLVHLSLTHLVFNLLLVAVLGRELERAYGTVTMALSMLFCAVGGSLAVLWFTPEAAVGGASTIGYGMFAMLVGLSVERRTDVRGPLALIGVNLAFTLTSPGVSLAGHLGGLAAGTVVAVVLWGRYRRGVISIPSS